MISSPREDALLAVHLESCHDNGHAICNQPERCAELFSKLRAGTDGSPAFDAFAEYRTFAEEQPHRGWTTAALIRGAEELLLSSPWGDDPFRRSVWLTSLLARLGERGIPADAMVRSCLSGALSRRIVFEATTAWYTLYHREADREDFPREVLEWVDILQDLLPPSDGEPETLTEVLIEAQAGQFGQFVGKWISTTAIAHVIQWLVKGSLETHVFPADRVVAGGSEATRWIFDRFSKTYLSEWEASSLLWEISFSDSPEAVARDAGVALDVLLEREITMTDLLDQLRSRHSRKDRSTANLGGANVEELVEQLLYLARSRDFVQARKLSEALVAEFPLEPYLRNAYAFLQIPERPEIALTYLLGSSVEESYPTLTLINVATCRLVDGQLHELPALIGKVRGSLEAETGEAWLWDPESIAGGSPSIGFMTFREWLLAFESVFTLQREA